MSNELEELSNWSPFLKENKASYTFNQFIDLIKSMDNNTSPDIWTKWKNFDNQVVIETPNHYYKLYQTNIAVGSFYAKIRETLGEIYRDLFHIHWDIHTIIKDNVLYQIEQREKLQVCNPSIISFDDLMVDWSKTLLLLENKLIIPKIAAQLKDVIPGLDSLKIIRDCVNKFEDYAITKDGNIVLLDDSDWFIGIIDEYGNWLNSTFNGYPVITKDGERLFAPQEYLELINDELAAKHVLTKHNKWTLIIKDGNEKEENVILDLLDQREQMIADNIKVLKFGKCLPNEKKLFVERYDECNLLEHKKEG